MQLLHQHIEALDESICLFQLFLKHAKDDLIRMYYLYLIEQLTTIRNILLTCPADPFEMLKKHFDQESPN